MRHLQKTDQRRLERLFIVKSIRNVTLFGRCLQIMCSLGIKKLSSVECILNICVTFFPA